MQTTSPEEIEVSIDKLLRDLKAVIRDGEELLRAGARDLSERGGAARERLAAALEVANDTQRRLQSGALAGAKTADRLVRDNPYESFGIAFGLGILMGFLAKRR
jgi:ElaB/YqjD/DUF883 family membrane-anchored ribosome-binding protein